MRSYTLDSLSRRFGLILSSFLQHDGLSFADVLDEAQIDEAFAQQDASFGNEPDAIYTPAVTLWAFLSQALHKEEHRSCTAAVARVAVMLVVLGRPACSTNTGAYCRARKKLSETVLRRLTLQVADGSEKQLPEGWLWHGRHVKLVDGTTVSMPDTPENQAEYPQPQTQEEGLGFPIARMVVMVSLATAMLSDMAMGPYTGKETGESALLRQLLARLERGDILLADRYFCSYFMIALLLEHNVDFVVRLHQHRTADFRRGKRLGKKDHLVCWQRPAKPDWMDQATYDRMPESIQVRQLEVHVDQPGFHTESFVVVTTLTDEREYSTADVAELYHKRWLVELDIRAIKITMDIDILRCQKPAMVRREIWTALLAYNLIRQKLLQTASGTNLSPRQLSFTAALQTIVASWTTALAVGDAIMMTLSEALLSSLAGHEVGNRPDRAEPRAIKRRPKPHKLLTKPRDQARAELVGQAVN